MRKWINIFIFIGMVLATVSFALAIFWLVYYLITVLLKIQLFSGTIISVVTTIVLMSIALLYLLRISTYTRGYEQAKIDINNSLNEALEEQVQMATTRPGKMNIAYWDGYEDAIKDLRKTIESGK